MAESEKLEHVHYAIAWLTGGNGINEMEGNRMSSLKTITPWENEFSPPPIVVSIQSDNFWRLVSEEGSSIEEPDEDIHDSPFL